VEEFKFYQTYYFCDVVNNVLRDKPPYPFNLNEFYGDGKIFNFLDGFQKKSIFHKFIYFVVSNVYDGHLKAFDLNESIELPIERAFEYYDVPHITFKEFYHDDGLYEHMNPEQGCHDYMEYLKSTGSYVLLLQKTTDEIFYIMFQNRELLMFFNQMLADNLEVEDIEDRPDEVQHLLDCNGHIVRKSPPAWVKKAVFFRDRGCCVICNLNLSGTLSLDNKENYDHIVPLARFGFNEVTNIQLLCEPCNLEKNAKEAITSGKIQPWF